MGVSSDVITSNWAIGQFQSHAVLRGRRRRWRSVHRSIWVRSIFVLTHHERPPDEHPRHPPELTRSAVVTWKLFRVFAYPSDPQLSILSGNSKVMRWLQLSMFFINSVGATKTLNILKESFWGNENLYTKEIEPPLFLITTFVIIGKLRILMQMYTFITTTKEMKCKPSF